MSHSNNEYGLRIYDTLIPLTHPCLPSSNDPSDAANPAILAKFENFLSYKNRKNGAIAEKLGFVQFHNFKTADNGIAGIEVSDTESIQDDNAKIVGALIVGKSANSEA